MPYGWRFVCLPLPTLETAHAKSAAISLELFSRIVGGVSAWTVLFRGFRWMA